VATSDKEPDLTKDEDRAIVNQLVKELRSKGPAVPTTHVARGTAFRGFSPPVEARALSNTQRTRPPSLAVEPTAGGVWGRIGLGVLLGIALTQWSYDHACGLGLLGYLSAVSLVIVAGIWGSVFAWRGRFALAHVVALATVFWGLALTTHEVLPHVGDAPTVAAWQCAVPYQ